MNAIEIYYNYASANKRAGELELTARKLTNLADNNLNSVLTKLDKVWDGDASRNYIQKGNQLREKIKRKAQSLINDAETIKRIAKRTYDAEMRALELSKNRSYH